MLQTKLARAGTFFRPDIDKARPRQSARDPRWEVHAISAAMSIGPHPND